MNCFFNDTATTEIYTLSLHDALPIYLFVTGEAVNVAKRLEEAAKANEILIGRSTHKLVRDAVDVEPSGPRALKDRKSTRLNSSHANISYAVFCLKKKQRVLPHSRSRP